MEPFGKRLVERLKSKGLDVAEEGAAIIVEGVFDELKFEVENNDQSWDDIFSGGIESIKKTALGYVDKIDGEDDEGR